MIPRFLEAEVEKLQFVFTTVVRSVFLVLAAFSTYFIWEVIMEDFRHQKSAPKNVHKYNPKDLGI